MVLILNKIKEWGIKLKNKINQENNLKKKQLKELRLSLMDEKKMKNDKIEKTF